jgi:hypothetical protein
LGNVTYQNEIMNYFKVLIHKFGEKIYGEGCTSENFPPLNISPERKYSW